MTASLPRSRRWPLLAVSALLAVALVGCGKESDDDVKASDPAPTTATSTPAEEPTASGSATADPSEAPTASGELPAWAPKIVTEGDKVTGLDFTGTPKPSDELQIATLIEGDGPPVEVGQTITANYFGSVYGSATPFDESFSTQPFQAPIGVGSLIKGWDEKIPGVPVGSRIIMSIPPALGYGDADQGPIPGGSTLFFVIDIISADAAS